MSKISGTFEQVWLSLQDEVKATGVVDGDLDQVRASVKNVLVQAGWADPSGAVNFVSESDQKTAIQAAAAEVARVAPNLAAARKVFVSPGSHPTKLQVLNASSQPTGFQGTAVSAAVPGSAKIGDKCPRCSGSMEPVGLVNDRAAIYCLKDKVVLPLPIGTSLR